MRLRYLHVLIIAAVLLVATTAAAHVSASRTAARAVAPQVVTSFSSIFNDGMKSGDFSAMASVFAPGATFTRSTPQGVTKAYHGLKAIIGAFTAIQKTFAGYQWTIDSMRPLDQWVVLAYEHAGSPPQSVPGRCMHVFVIVDGKIRSYDWTTFYPGKP
jgi:hypothetical protein